MREAKLLQTERTERAEKAEKDDGVEMIERVGRVGALVRMRRTGREESHALRPFARGVGLRSDLAEY